MATRVCQRCNKSERQLGGGKKLSLCSRCGVAAYCSRDCQVAAWSEHKRVCGKTSVKPSTTTTGTATATTVDPFDEFKPFLESISEEVAAVLAIPYFDNMYGPPANRTSILFHLHFKHVDSSQTSNLRNRFRLDESVRQVTPGDFISWLRATVPGAESVVPQYERMFAEIKMTDARKAATVGASAGSGSVELTASVRLVCTAQNETGRFMGLRTSVVTLQTRTRSGLDPRNRGLSFDKPLRAIINDNIDHSAQLTANSNAKTDEDAATEHASARSLTLLKRVVKEFSRDDAWAQRAHDSGPIDQDDPWDDLGLAARAIQLGVDEKVMLGGRDRKAFIYAVPVPEIRTRCPCGDYHGIEGHVDANDDDDDHDEHDSDDDNQVENDHAGHTHSHGH